MIRETYDLLDLQTEMLPPGNICIFRSDKLYVALMLGQ